MTVALTHPPRVAYLPAERARPTADDGAPHAELLADLRRGATIETYVEIADFVLAHNDRPDRYARWWPTWVPGEGGRGGQHVDQYTWKVAKRESFLPISREVLLAHLLDGANVHSPVGIYSPDPAGNTIAPAFDVDSPLDHKRAGGEQDPQKLQTLLESVGFPYFVNTSKGGKGTHFRSYGRAPVSGPALRRLAEALVRSAGLPETTEFFPKQARPMDCGNQIALFGSAYWIARTGGTVVYDRAGSPVRFVDLVRFLREVPPLTDDVVRKVGARLGVDPFAPPVPRAAVLVEGRRREERGGPLDGTWQADPLGEVLRLIDETGWESSGRSRESNGSTLLDVACPQEGLHSSSSPFDSAVIVNGSGGFRYRCQHAHCDHLEWADFRAAADPAKRFRFRYSVTERRYSERERDCVREPGEDEEPPACDHDPDPPRRRGPPIPNYSEGERVRMVAFARANEGRIARVLRRVGQCGMVNQTTHDCGDCGSKGGTSWARPCDRGIMCRYCAHRYARILAEHVKKKWPERVMVLRAHVEAGNREALREKRKEIVLRFRKGGGVTGLPMWIEGYDKILFFVEDTGPGKHYFMNAYFRDEEWESISRGEAAAEIAEAWLAPHRVFSERFVEGKEMLAMIALWPWFRVAHLHRLDGGRATAKTMPWITLGQWREEWAEEHEDEPRPDECSCCKKKRLVTAAHTPTGVLLASKNLGFLSERAEVKALEHSGCEEAWIAKHADRFTMTT